MGLRLVRCRSVIIQVINKSDSRFAVVQFRNHSYDYRPNWTPLSPIIINYHDHWEQVCAVEIHVMADRPETPSGVFKSLGPAVDDTASDDDWRNATRQHSLRCDPNHTTQHVYTLWWRTRSHGVSSSWQERYWLPVSWLVIIHYMNNISYHVLSCRCSTTFGNLLGSVARLYANCYVAVKWSEAQWGKYISYNLARRQYDRIRSCHQASYQFQIANWNSPSWYVKLTAPCPKSTPEELSAMTCGT